jgi:hypothetical protein
VNANQDIQETTHQPAAPTELWTPKTMAAGGGSYMEQYRRLKKRADYKAYTIDDYRKLQKEVKLNLGALGPDMESDTLKERVRKIPQASARVRCRR